MRIESLSLRNYRQFRDVTLQFKARHDSDLQVVIGDNGSGKSNILNALNWCLYGDEPHLSIQSANLPLLNLGTIEESGHSGQQDVVVQVGLSLDDGTNVFFRRRNSFNLYPGTDVQPMSISAAFESRTVGIDGNTEILENEDASNMVSRFVPMGIREFFFFDGERLDTYFRQATAQNIRHAIFEIAQISLLDQVEAHLHEVRGSLQRVAGKSSPKLETLRSTLETAERLSADLERRFDEATKQVRLAKEKIAERQEELKGVPAVEQLGHDRETLKEEFRLLEAKRVERVRDKQGMLAECGTIVALWPAIRATLEAIDEKRSRKEIPPTYDPNLLELIMKSGRCEVCGRDLDQAGRQRVSDLAKQIQVSSGALRELLAVENSLRMHRERFLRFGHTIREATGEISGLQARMNTIQKRVDEIDLRLSGYDIERIRIWHKELCDYEARADDNNRLIGELREQRKTADKRKEEAETALDEAMRKESVQRSLVSGIHWCERAVAVASAVKNDIMVSTRNDIQKETRERFLEMLWKTETYSDVRIAEDFQIGLIHKLGYECLGSTSSGERELLALAFTLALHRVSGFDSPLLIDTPVARLSGPREAFASVFARLGQRKQTILLFLPSEYSPDVSMTLDPAAAGRYHLRPSSDETETKLEVL